MPSGKSISRLSLYRRILERFQQSGVENVYSHQLAAHASVTSAQVRRDLMAVGYSGSPNRGYDVARLLESVGEFLDPPTAEKVALVGVGNLGRAILAYFHGRRAKLTITAAFDSDERKTGRVIHGCRCYPMEQMAEIIAAEGIAIGVVAVPAEAAQEVTDALVRAGVRGILNFAPTPLRASGGVFVEDIDMTMALEKVAYFARTSAPATKEARP